MTNISEEKYADLFLSGTPLIDVRAPVEFAQGHLPGAVNLPLLNDEERALVGTAYKQKGNEAAVALGHKLVFGAVKDTRLQAWAEQVKSQPSSVLYCFRGGLRSQTTQAWLVEAGFPRPLIIGGYKKVRQFLMDSINATATSEECLVLSGPTGSAKTALIKRAAEFYPAVDLEGLAQHRGSAFGAMTPAQPAQAQFENLLAVELLKIAASRAGTAAPLQASSSKVRTLFEDESRLIGRSVIPDLLFASMRKAKVFFVEESFEQRVQNIFDDYITTTAIGCGSEQEALAVFARYKASTQAISRRLGGARTEEVLQDLDFSEREYLAGRGLESHREWIGKLLKYYYDPLYTDSFQRRQPEIEFRGSGEDILQKLRSFRAGC